MKRLMIAVVALCLIATGANSFWQSRDSTYNLSSGAPMVTPILVAGSTFAPSNTAITFSTFNSSTRGVWWNAAENLRSRPWAVSGTFSNLKVIFPTTILAGTYTITLRICPGGTSCADSTLTCTLDSVTNTQTCSDTHVVSITAGDSFDIKLCPSNVATCPAGAVPTAQAGPTQVALSFTSTNNNESALTNSIPTSAFPSGTVVNYGGFGGQAFFDATNDTRVASIMPTAGKIDNLYVQTSVAPGAGKSWTYTLQYDGSAPAGSPTCTISGASATSCTSVGGTNTPITVAAGHTLGFSITPSGASISGGIIGLSVRWVPTTPGEAVQLEQCVCTPSTNSTNFTYVNGQTNSGEGSDSNELNVASVAFNVKKLYVAQDAVPGGATSRTYTLRHGTVIGGGSQANSSLACTVTSAATTCSADPGTTYSASAGDLLDFAQSVSGTNAAVAWMKMSTVVCVVGAGAPGC